MGYLLNPGNGGFKRSVQSEIYIDKTMLLNYTNRVFNTRQCCICVSRPRRFGKSMAAEMIAAYYGAGCDSKELFKSFRIAGTSDYEKYLNKCSVIHLNMQDFLNFGDRMTDEIQTLIIKEVRREFEKIDFYYETIDLMLKQAYSETRKPFVFILDEWDCVFREFGNNAELQKKYLDFLRYLLKDKEYVGLAYMTGILPIKKYGKHSALNMFTEISMISPEPLEEFTGFTEPEVKMLCEKYNIPFDEVTRWYDGYTVDGLLIYNPKSVVDSMLRGKIGDYWTQTETYEALKIYIQGNLYGIQDIILKLLAGEEYRIDAKTFSNDMVTFESADDILTLLVHLGYLTYSSEAKTVRIPNYEIREQFVSTVRLMGWKSVAAALENSEKLMEATLKCDGKKVAEYLEAAHQDNSSILKYNDENSLSCVISLAYYSARNNYCIYREMPSGKGFADLVFIPKRHNLPAIVVELKSGESAKTALRQIRDKNYCDCLKDYSGEILLVGINYDRDTKKHDCIIEKIVK